MYVLSLFFAVLLGVGLHCFLGVPASMNDVRPRGVRVVCRLLVMSTLVMLGRSPACNGDLDTGTPNDSARGCMAQKGYIRWCAGIRLKTCVQHMLPVLNTPCRTDDG